MPELSNLLWYAGGAFALFAIALVCWFSIFRRVVVPTSEVHIIQRNKQTIDTPA